MKAISRGLLLTALSFCGLVSTNAAAQQVDVWVTHPDKSRLISWDGKRTFDYNGNVDGNTITINANQVYQEIDGFGAAMTESSAWLIQNKMSASQRNALLEKMFGFNDGAAGISYVRIPLGASDFSTSWFTFDDTCCDLNDFNASRATNLLGPLMRRARELNGSLKLMGTPWTPPGWMKSSNWFNGGKLNPWWYATYADYLRRTYDAFNNAGMRFDSMSAQNEPLLEVGYPSAKYEWWDELNFVRGHLAPRMAGTGVKLLAYDHNWDAEWYPDAVLREGTAYYAGTAWHCYAGNPSAMSRIHDRYPDEEIHITECSGAGASNFGPNMRWNMENMFIGGVRNWARSVMMWNLALDPYGNPHTGGCPNCRGVVTIDQNTGNVTYNEEFYAIAHFARFVWPGARRIGSSNSGSGNFISAAFRNANGNKTAVVFNKGNSTQTFRMVENGRSISVTLPSNGLATVFW